jgi:uncharacterized protein (DUF58 family)
LLQTYLDPKVLAAIGNLDLIAKTVVKGFVNGLHRSPDFGFSQEFAEYRAYAPGDDLRHVDWNVFARTERAYLKRYRGETNSQLTILLDASKSMAYGKPVTKMDYARFLASSLAYLGSQQRDASGLIVFDDGVREFVEPSTRQGQLHRVLHAIEHAEPRARTDYAKPFVHFQQFLRRRGMVVVISDFWEQPETVVKAVSPLRWKGNDVVLFHVLDRQEIRPKLSGPAILIDMENEESMEVSPDYAKHEYAPKIDAHLASMKEEAKKAGLDYWMLPTDKPLDEALREYLMIRQGRH